MRGPSRSCAPGSAAGRLPSRSGAAWLTDLDGAIGDGDHGINLDRGLTAVVADLASPDAPDEAGPLLAAAGRRLMGVVGGASGALYGQALLRAGEAVTGDPDPDRLGETALAAAIDAVSGLGKAVPGDKTMLDALVPALDVAACGRDAGGRAVRPSRRGRGVGRGRDGAARRPQGPRELPRRALGGPS